MGEVTCPKPYNWWAGILCARLTPLSLQWTVLDGATVKEMPALGPPRELAIWLEIQGVWKPINNTVTALLLP